MVINSLFLSTMLTNPSFFTNLNKSTMKRVTMSLLLCMLTVLSTNVIAQNLSQSVNQELTQLLEKNVLQSQDIQWEMTSSNVSRTSGIEHVYYRQLVNGIPVYGTESGLHLKATGEVFASDNRFVDKTIDKITGTTPSLTAIGAVQAAASQLNYSITEAIFEVESIGGASRQVVLSDGGMSLSTIPVKLMYQLNNDNELVLVWDLSIEEINRQDWWNIRLDASTGTILDKNNYMVSCAIEHNHSEDDVELNYNKNLYDIPNYNESVAEETAGCSECYEVFDLPLESPYHGVRTTVMSPADPIASPFGWHDTDGVAGAESTLTTGNNTNTYDAGMGGYQTDGGATLDFTGYPFDEVYTNSNQYDDASLTQLFWANNVIHDVFYQYGFDEDSGNFQVNNYGNGGLGNDPVDAEGQSGLVCNAFMGTPPDGSSPTMMMFVCNDKDGDFDSLVVFHEWGHGISNRLTGGPTNVGCLNNSEQMGEGWGDFLGIAMTIEPGDMGTDPRGVGSYLLGQGIGGVGVRQYHYTTDLTINPHTYDDIGNVAIPHGVGSIWSAMLWEVTWALIDEHGFDEDIYTFTGDVNQDSGIVQALALVTEGMKLQPCSPGFVDGRDAIFAADQAIYGGANECLLWDAFAKRGLGFSADQGSSGSVTDGTAAYDSPVPAINTAEEVCVGQGVQVYGGGTPTGGEYAGPGVTDDGNGMTYTFDPAAAGVGVHTIEYTVASACASGAATDTIEVLADEPVLECQDVTLELDANGEVTLTIQDVVTNLEPGALVVDQTGTFAPIDISATGTAVALGDDTGSAALAIGFDFSFYDVNYSDFYIASNGFVSFSGNGMTGAISRTATPLPTAGDPNDIIALMWEDLDPSAGGTIRYETMGTAPDRVLIVDFDAVPYWNTSVVITTQLQLFETSNRIEIHSTSVPGDGPATQGVENVDGTMGLTTPGRSAEVWSATDDYVAYYYQVGGPGENCGLTTTLTLSQELFTCDDRGDNVITVTLTDSDGNTSTCTPTVTITDPLDVCPPLGVEDNEFANNLSIFPNPSNGQITIANTSNFEIRSATITDINGRTVQTLDVADMESQTTFSIEKLATGMYFIKIEADNASIVKRILKK